jgi:methionyl-tRNA synthetase
MSKSKGTFVKARTYLDFLNPQDLRFYYACKLNGTTDDLDMNLGDFVNRVNSDLVGKITNLASRGAQMLHKSLGGKTGEMDAEGRALWQTACSRADAVAAYYEARDFGKVMVEIRDLADAANQYFDTMAPWALVKTDLEAARQVMTSVLNIFRVLAIYLQPVLPVYSERVAKLFDEQAYQWSDLETAIENKDINPYEYLATRVDPVVVEKMIEASKAAAPVAKPAGATDRSSAVTVEPIKETIDYDTFAKMDLRVATVASAEYVEGADKLLKVMLDIGEAKPRQVFAGIRKAYDPAKLVGRQVVMVANLAPRKMKFGMSEGMILAAGNPDGALFVVSPDAGALAGSTVK